MRNRNSYRRSSGVCPNCGHTNRPDARMCVECYTSLRGSDVERSSPDPSRRLKSRRSRSSGASRADAIRAQARGTDHPTSTSRSESQPWWQD